MRRGAWLAAAACLSLLSGAALAADDQEACPTAKVPPLVLPHLRDTLAANHEATIVALGSSSTEGWRASNAAHTYPALLQASLNALLPASHIAVLNRGVAGEDVAEELPRIERDGLRLHPTVVIWQVGANGAMRGLAPELFKRMLMAGVKRLMDSKVDVVLMDNQKAPKILAAPEHALIDQAMAEVAADTGARLFGRGALMQQWKEEGFPFARFISDDGVHHNDYGYRCVTAVLAGAIVDGLRLDIATTQTAKK